MYTILGATGKVGGKITDILLRKGEPVRVVARSADRLKSYGSRGAEIYQGDLRDRKFLAAALSGSTAVFTLIPPSFTEADFGAYQDAVGESIREAVMEAKVIHVVHLSSIGADLPDGTGPIAGLYRQEQRLNKIQGLHVLHLRPAYFMENLLMQIPLVKSKGIMGSAMLGDLRFPMIATRDIAQVAADRLVRRDFTGSTVLDLLGQRDLSHAEAAGIIGKAINMPKLSYVQVPYDEAEKGLVAAGLTPDLSRLYVEMGRAFNEGKIGKELKRTPKNTTPTSFEEFVEVFAHAFREAKAA